MHRCSSRVLLILTAAVAVIAVAAGAVFAAQPKPGKYHWVACGASGPPCPTVSVDFSVKKGPVRIVGFSYYNGRTCGGVSVTKAIKVKHDGRFHFSGKGPGEVGKISLTVNGRFVSSKKAKGTVSCQMSKAVKFTATRQ